MSSWFKYGIWFALFTVAFVSLASIGLRSETNVTATQEVQGMVASAKIGKAREDAANVIDKKALATNFILDIAKTHKEQGEKVEIDYVYLDESGNPTTVEENINSVQFKVDVVTDEGTVVSTSQQRLKLNME